MRANLTARLERATTDECIVYGLLLHMQGESQMDPSIMPPVGLEDCPCDVEVEDLMGLVEWEREHVESVISTMIEKEWIV